MTRHTPRGGTTRWLRLAPRPLRGYYSSFTHTMRDFNDVLPSKWGHDEAIDELEATRDATPVVGEQAQIDYVAQRKEVAEIAWGRIETAVKLRLESQRQEWLTLAKNKLKTHLYDTDFEQRVNDILDDAWSLTLIEAKNL